MPPKSQKYTRGIKEKKDEIPTIDTRKAWLDELQVHTEHSLMKITEKVQERRDLTPIELNMQKSVAPSLYTRWQKKDFSQPDDPDNPFEQETIH